MSLKTIVKVSHVSNLSDARYCAGMGVEMLGFRVIPGADRYISPEVYQEIRGWISGPDIVAELYGLSDIAQIATVMQTYAPDYFELPYAAYRQYRAALQLPCIVTVRSAAELFQVREDGGAIHYLLTDADVSCNDLAQAAYPVLKKTTSVQALKTHLKEGCFKGFELAGPEADRPGITNYDQLGEILEALDTD